MFARMGIGTKLTLAFAALAAVTVVVVIAVFFAGASAKRDIGSAEAARAPASVTAHAQAALLRMQLHVRGYLVLGGRADIEQYEVQRRAFEASLAVLKSLAAGWSDTDAKQLADLAAAYRTWMQLPPKLFELHDNALKNRPALRLARFELQPRRVAVLNQVDAIIGAQKEREPSAANRQLAADLAGFQTSFDAMVTNLMAYAASGDLTFKLSYGPQLATNAALWGALSDKSELLDPRQRARLATIARERAEVGELALQIVDIVGGEHAFEDLYVYRTEAAPRAQEMLNLLESLTARQQSGLQADLSRARDNLARGSVPVLLGGLLAIALAVTLAIVSQRRIVGPVRKLTEMAEQLAAGELAPGADDGSQDEIGRLARTINTRLRKEELQHLMASISDCLWRAEVAADGAFSHHYVSPAVERIAGRPAGHFIGSPQPWFDIVHAEDAPALKEAFARIATGLTEREETEYRIARPDGAERWVRDSLRAARLADGRIVVHGVVSDITERKLAENALKVSEQRSALAMQAAGEGHWDWDVARDEFWASPRLLEMYGFPEGTTFDGREDFLRRFPFFPRDESKWREAVDAHFSGTTARFDIEMRMIPRGEERWMHLTGIVTRDRSGRPVRWTGAVNDITERKRVEEALRLSEERHALAMEAAGDGHWDWNIAEDKFYASPRLLAISGLPTDLTFSSREEFMQHLHIHPEDRPRYVDAVARHFAGTGTRFEMELRHVHGGRTHWVHVTGLCLRDANGNPTRWSGCVTDVSDRKRAQEELHARQEMLDLAQAAAHATAFEWCIGSGDGENRWSTHLEIMYGLEPGTYDGTYATWKKLVHPDDWPAVKMAMKRAAETGEVAAEYRVVHRDGSIHSLQARGRMFFDSAGTPVRMVGFMQDVTEQRKAETEMRALERQLQRSQRLESLGTLAGGIAHDFNNILGAILGYSEMAQRDAGEVARLKRDLDGIVTAGERGRALVDRILAFSRSGMGERTAVNVEQVVREALDLLAGRASAGIRVEASLNAPGAAMLGDSSQVHQVFMNLATNAIQAMASGGTLSVSVEARHLEAPRMATIGAVSAGDYIVLTVADTGCGIPPEIVERIFDPFFTTKDVGVGTGLGLSLVHGIVSEVAGAIDVASTPGAGSRFTVYLPRQGETWSAPDAVEDSMPLGRRQRVLVVDDEEPLVAIANDTLERLGYVPVTFTSSAKALAAFRERPGDFDVIITDERMPGLSGTELIREVRTISRAIPIVLMSGYLSGIVASGARGAGADEILKKPLSARELATSLARVLETE